MEGKRTVNIVLAATSRPYTHQTTNVTLVIGATIDVIGMIFGTIYVIGLCNRHWAAQWQFFYYSYIDWVGIVDAGYGGAGDSLYGPAILLVGSAAIQANSGLYFWGRLPSRPL